jgi:hypothetical protein
VPGGVDELRCSAEVIGAFRVKEIAGTATKVTLSVGVGGDAMPIPVRVYKKVAAEKAPSMRPCLLVAPGGGGAGSSDGAGTSASAGAAAATVEVRLERRTTYSLRDDDGNGGGGGGGAGGGGGGGIGVLPSDRQSAYR